MSKPTASQMVVYIGLAVTAFNNTKISTATFANVSITGQATPAIPTNLTASPLSGTSASLQVAG